MNDNKLIEIVNYWRNKYSNDMNNIQQYIKKITDDNHRLVEENQMLKKQSYHLTQYNQQLEENFDTYQNKLEMVEHQSVINQYESDRINSEMSIIKNNFNNPKPPIKPKRKKRKPGRKKKSKQPDITTFF